jgi:oxygen-dependent protoporphyrinogen oxidase
VDRARANIAVVGAGLAGLAVGWRLSRRGFRVVVLERAAAPGGRLSALPCDGFRLEAIPPVHSAGDRRLLGFIDEVGLRDDALPLRPLVRCFPHAGGLREVELRSPADVRRVPGIRRREALRLVRLPRLLARYGHRLDPERPAAAADLDDRSLADFCELYFGGSVLDRWMAPIVTSASLGDPREMSRVQFLLELRRAHDARPGVPRASLAELVERAASQLPLQLACGAKSLEPPRDGRPRLRLDDGRGIAADAVVLAVPAPQALTLADPLLTPAERDGLARVRYESVLTVAAPLCRPLSARPQQILVPRSLQSPIESATIEPGLPSTRVPEGRGLALIRARGDFAAASAGAPDEAVAKELLGALESLRPGIERVVDFSRVLRIPLGVPRFDVGRYRAIARFDRVQRDRRAAGRRLYFAGDYRVHPSVEGALASAAGVAEAVERDLSGGCATRDAP